MIGLMQKRKKYVMIIIWVSSIAFLGAGFVGWGSYNFSSTSNAVAVVGTYKITPERLQREYARLYNMYNQLFNGNLDDEQAQNIGIQQQALNTLIARALMLNYAKDVGLRASEEEIIQAITTMEIFQENGVFNEGIYRQLLTENQIRPRDFEEELEEGILLQKLGVLVEIPLTPLEIQTIGESFFSEDHLKIQILDQSAIIFKPTEEDIRAYWESNKDIYQTQRGYEILKVSVDINSTPVDDASLKQYYEDFKNQFLDSNGQLIPFEQAKDEVMTQYRLSQAEKESLREYISLRRGANPKAESLVIYEGDPAYDVELFNSLSQANEQETLKPIRTDKGFITAKIQKIIPSKPKNYEAAKQEVTEDFTALKAMQLLEEKAIALLADFQGTDAGYIARDSAITLKNLTAEESQDFIAQLFNKTEAKGYIPLKDKVILYEILDQRLKKSDIITQNLELIKSNGSQIKSRLTEIAFMEYLSSLYKVVRKI